MTPDLTDQVLWLPATDRYSFLYQGSAQVLDHALTSAGFGTFVRGMVYGRGNADAAEWFEDQDATPLRCSDHDGLVLFVMTDADGNGVPDDAPVFTVLSQLEGYAAGTVTDDTGIVSLVLLPGSVNAVLTPTGGAGDPSWSWTVTGDDLLAPATAILQATDEDGHTTTLTLQLRALEALGIPALGSFGLALLTLLLLAAGAVVARRLG